MTSQSAQRVFGGINDIDGSTDYSNISAKADEIDDMEAKLDNLRNDMITSRLNGPLGYTPCVYLDYTASGRVLRSLESYLVDQVMPLYGNTHTTSSHTGHQSTCYRHEARQIIAEATNAKITGRAAVDTVIFTGNGTTSGFNKLVEVLGLNISLPLSHLYTSSSGTTAADSSESTTHGGSGTNHSNGSGSGSGAVYDESFRPVVFVSSYEHHSNLLPWRESVAEVVVIAYHHDTGVCLTDLQRKIELYKHRRLKIGSFAAASNITGKCVCVCVMVVMVMMVVVIHSFIHFSTR